MEFLKRHYEKLILLALSIISAFAVWRMSGVMEETKNVKDSDLEIDIPAADQVSLKRKKEIFKEKTAELDKARKAAAKNKDDESREKVSQLEEELKKLREDESLSDFRNTEEFEPKTLIGQTKLLWPRSTPGSAEYANYHSDLVDIFPMAECPHCHYGVPLYCFRKHGDSGNKCVICGQLLKDPPQKIKKRRKPTPDDLDGDGINNDNEMRYGLNSKDPGDALLDDDGDGFSNLYEINVSNTDPRNPTSCPPLWRRLRFKRMAKIELPIHVTSVDFGANPADPKSREASIRLEYRDPRTGRLRTRDQDCKIGDTLKFDGRRYEVTSIERQLDKGENGIERKKDIVTLKMIAENEEEKSQVHELKLVFGQPVFSPDLRVVLEDIGVPEDTGIPDEPGVPPEKRDKRFYLIRGAKKKAIFELREGEMFEMGGVSDRGSARNVRKETYVLKSFDEKNHIAQLSRVKTRTSGDEGLELDDQGVLMEITPESYIVEDEWVTLPVEKTAEEKTQGAPERRRRR